MLLSFFYTDCCPNYIAVARVRSSLALLIYLFGIRYVPLIRIQDDKE
jgi:hypothetical protein